MLQIDAVAVTMTGMFSPVTGTQSRSAVGSAVVSHSSAIHAAHDYTITTSHIVIYPGNLATGTNQHFPGLLGTED